MVVVASRRRTINPDEQSRRPQMWMRLREHSSGNGRDGTAERSGGRRLGGKKTLADYHGGLLRDIVVMSVAKRPQVLADSTCRGIAFEAGREPHTVACHLWKAATRAGSLEGCCCLDGRHPFFATVSTDAARGSEEAELGMWSIPSYHCGCLIRPNHI